MLISEEFVNRLSKLKKICHHFHLSLQSGSNETLKRMNRSYTTSEFEKIVSRLRTAYSDCILTTDIIVGFPGETEKEFEQTYEFLKKIKFYKMHIFKYSIRKGTKAAEMKNQVLAEVKEDRSNKLLELSDRYEKEYLESYINKEIEVLFEDKENEFWQGHTSNYLVVKVKSEQDLNNRIIKVKLNEVDGLALIGKII